MITWTDELIAQISAYDHATLSYSGQDGYPVTLPLSFTFDKAAHLFTFAVPSLPPAIALGTENAASLTLLKYDSQRANEAYMLIYGQVATSDSAWTFTPSTVIMPSW
jgi:hypothetical protein